MLNERLIFYYGGKYSKFTAETGMLSIPGFIETFLYQAGIVNNGRALFLICINFEGTLNSQRASMQKRIRVRGRRNVAVSVMSIRKAQQNIPNNTVVLLP